MENWGNSKMFMGKRPVRKVCTIRKLLTEYEIEKYWSLIPNDIVFPPACHTSNTKSIKCCPYAVSNDQEQALSCNLIPLGTQTASIHNREKDAGKTWSRDLSGDLSVT